MATNPSSIDYAYTGALTPPPSIMPHFYAFGKQQTTIIAIAVIFITLPTIFVGLRLWTKLRISKDMGWDDYTCFAAYLLWLISPSLMIAVRHDGYGLHQWDVTLEQFLRWFKVAEATAVIYGPITALTRISLLLQFLRIFVPLRTPRKLFYFVQGLVLFNIIFFTADVFMVIFQCTPQEKVWNPSTPGHCINKSFILLRPAVANVFTDVFIAVLPAKIIWGLQMPRRRKISVTAVFASGLLACVCAILRLIEAIVWRHSTDLSYRLSVESFWVGAEVVFGLICGCLPIMPRFFFHYYPKLASMLCFNRGSDRRRHHSSIKSHSEVTGPPKVRWPGRSLDVPGFDSIYTELDDFRGQERTYGRSVTIEGGLNYSLSTHEGWSPYTDSFADLEIGTPTMAIRKTVRVESIMEP